jgi:23S rRNA pseudouridine1911/1915/1917 synthase
MSLEVTRGRRFSVESRCQLLAYLMGPVVGCSRKRAKDLLRRSLVSVTDRERVKHDTELSPGDTVTIVERVRGQPSLLEHFGLTIVHLDDAVVVVDKPAGLLSMGSDREKQRTAHRFLNEHLKALTKSSRQQAFIVHRLDRETSGLMMFARNESIQMALRDSWKEVGKKYLAVVEGAPPGVSGTLRDQLAETKALKVRRVENGGRLAITHYRVIRRRADRSLLELTLETGRKNQIRVQVAAAGFPIVGDRKYGAKTDPARRLALHSCELSFRHPTTQLEMRFQSELPARLKGLV